MELNEIHSPGEHASASLKTVLLVFAIVLIGVLGYLVYQQNTEVDNTDYSAPKTTKTEETVPATTDETADWKTYKNSDYSFYFKHPSDYTVTESSDTYLLIRKGDLDIIRVTIETRSAMEMFESNLTALEYAKKVAVNGCAADGPTGSITCKDEVMSSSITTAGKIAGYVLKLTEVATIAGKETTATKQVVALDVQTATSKKAYLVTFERPSDYQDNLAEKIAKTFTF